MKRYSIMLVCLLLATVTEAQKKEYPSFLGKEDVPDSRAFLPAPPDTTSMAFFADYSQYLWGKSMRDTPRGKQAIRDADMDIDSMFVGFNETCGMTLSKNKFPETWKLCFMVTNDTYNSSNPAKKFYKRKRPYVRFHEETLIPQDEKSHLHSGSYPSSHSASGWAMTLILVELFPEHQDAIIRRGYEFGQSRVIAGYHYQSDVDAARLVGSAIVARLHADEGFQKQLSLAKKEILKCTK